MFQVVPRPPVTTAGAVLRPTMQRKACARPNHPGVDPGAGTEWKPASRSEVYEFEGTRFDVQPARRRVQTAVIDGAADDSYAGEPVKVASLRDLLFLKAWAASERPEAGKKAQDKADIVQLLEHNADRVAPQDIASIVRDLAALAYTPQEAESLRQVVGWINDTLD